MVELLDVVGDVHGCADELGELLRRLGYALPSGATGQSDGQGQGGSRRPHDGELALAAHPDGRRLVFVGDLVNRGPDPVRALEMVMGLCRAGVAMSVLGNHDDQLRAALSGRTVEPTPEMEQTLAALAARPAAFRDEVQAFLDSLPGHLVLDDGQLVVAHAGLPAEYHGCAGSEARELAVYGPSTGRHDAYGFPERIRPTPLDWDRDYAGQALVVHGHQAIEAPRWIGRTVNIDTNCSRGGALTALRYPEQHTVSVTAIATYWTPRS